MSASAGRVLLMPRGTYDPSETYVALDYVSYGVSSYVCKKESSGNAPTNTEYWQILAKGISSVAPELLGIGYGVSADTGVGTAKTATLTGYALTVNGLVAVTFADNVPANATLNINSQGAKPIYYRGAAVVANVIRGGDTVTFAYDGTNYNILCIDGGAGHAIENSAGTELTQRDVMQFVDLKASDDSTNEKTKIEMIQVVTAAQLANAGDGAYIVSDEDEVYMSAAEMGYDHTGSGLVAMNVQDAIDEVAGITDDLTTSVNEKADQTLLAPVEPALVASQNYVKDQQFVYQGLLYKLTAGVSQGDALVVGTNCELSPSVTEQIRALDRGSVSVTADGVKTRSQVLDSLYAEADISKVTINSKIAISSDIHTLCSKSGNVMRFSSNISMDSTQSTTSHILFRASNSENMRCICNNGSTNTINDISSTKFASGTEITLYY